MSKPRKKDTPVEKVAILRRHLIDHVPVSDLSDEHQLSPTLFYFRQKPSFENGPPLGPDRPVGPVRKPHRPVRIGFPWIKVVV
jgi:hypothetical protein